MDTDLLLLEQFIIKHPLRAARAVEGLEDEELSAFVEEMPADTSLKLISLMNMYKVAKCLPLLPIDLAVQLLEKSGLPRVELLMRQLDEDFRTALLDRLSPKLSATLRQKLEYPDQTVGALMATSFFLLQEDMTVRDAIAALKREKSQISSSIYVIDRAGNLTGMIRPHELLLANEADEISAMMKTEIPKFFADMPVDPLKDHPAWYENRSVPVVDKAGKLIGAIDFEAVQKINMDAGEEMTKHLMETSNALGELYRIGLTAFLQSVSK